MPPIPAVSLHRVGAVARWVIVTALAGLAAVKFVSDPKQQPFEIEGLADVVSSGPMRYCAAVVELVLAVGMATRWHRYVVRAVVAWLTVLAGVLGAFVVGGIPLERCGCFGARSGSLASHVEVLVGLSVLAALALKLGGDERVESQEGSAPRPSGES